MLAELEAAPESLRAPKKKASKKVSGYQFFLRVCLEEMKAQYPDASIVLSAVSKLCAENWQNMSDELRQRFYEEADKMNSKNAQNGGDSVGKVVKQRRIYKRRPITAFKVFWRERRRKVKRTHPEFSRKEINCHLSNAWANSDHETKRKYEELARTENEIYEEKRIAGMNAVELTAEPEEEAKDVDETIEEQEIAEDEDEEMQMQA